VPTFTKEPVKSGEKGEINVTYNGKGLMTGRFSKTITVRSNAKNKIVRLIIEGEMTE
jgi:flagella basal body P-ring formation protein FlgA